MCACGKFEGVGFCGGPGCEFPGTSRYERSMRNGRCPELGCFLIKGHPGPHSYSGDVASAAATAAQPTPKGQGPDITPLVIADLQARSAAGTAKYGEPLRARNGRDALTDAYQEALDLCQYLRQAIAERDGA